MSTSSLLFIILYIIFLILGKIKYYKAIEKFTDVIVILLIFSISFWAGEEVLGIQIVSLLSISLIFSILSIIVTYLLGFIVVTNKSLLMHKEKINGRKLNNRNEKIIITKYMIPFILGWIIGVFIRVNRLFLVGIINYELYALASILGYIMGKEFNIKLIIDGGKDALLSILITVIGDVIIGALLFLMHVAPINVSLVISLASGWYSYVGPLVALEVNPYLGTLAFLINFLREQLTYVFVPLLLRLRFEPKSAIAVGGATAMDTTLPLYVETLGKEYAITAMITGFLLTFAIPIILPLLL
ncbi:hypothetical protein BFU36_10330 [Sulfolobus sp. A20]|nr:hypothetical protein BFU36_10330 [Sulfolobus sp. A20]TRM77511.1 DUF340 domain-containing protein [Sulfolobus sp. A20-N-F8]TRM79324.1 DUF340 domain-containing protein [Sulfolobus sp. B5]TRM82992.1 DUF340 domain-containing protein [Sulfolobus sp. A20-N-F6]TRM89426.1 DUF340 domain-containing protein [Sulfolobus sp. C3]TRM89724.1 DUF340 domain-containing protein [Sulfolobus sp. A20-N-G8]TRN00270.1 DUF340 domain-containing protein [Sulfolobus sp. F1]